MHFQDMEKSDILWRNNEKWELGDGSLWTGICGYLWIFCLGNTWEKCKADQHGQQPGDHIMSEAYIAAWLR